MSPYRPAAGLLIRAHISFSHYWIASHAGNWHIDYFVHRHAAMTVDALRRYCEFRDTRAFEELFRHYEAQVQATCRRLLSSTEEVDDAVQETFIKLAERADQVHTNPGAWLTRCAHTTALDMRSAKLARANQVKTLKDIGTDVQQSASSNSQLERAEDASIVARCLDDLSHRDRILIMGYFFRDQTQRALAHEIGVSQVGVKKRLDRVLKDLRRKCMDHGVLVA
jgi:RNA polymerase sigma factor (sigma-70 family)